MNKEQIHRDLKKFLRQKFTRAIQDHIELCEDVELDGSRIAEGLADSLLHLVSGYFMMLNLTPQQFGQICHDAYKELQDERREKEV
jgi:hypothetical protein